jgi:hypothetical protein
MEKKYLMDLWNHPYNPYTSFFTILTEKYIQKGSFYPRFKSIESTIIIDLALGVVFFKHFVLLLEIRQE